MMHCEMTDKSESSSQSISQLFIAILRPGLLHRFLLQLNLSARLCQAFMFLRCSLLLVCFLQSSKQSPVTFPQNAKERLHHCNSLGVNIPPISIQCHCLPDSLTVLLAKQLWKSPLVFFSFFFPLLFSFRWLWASELLITLSVLSSWISPWS